jgi:hypothetical protein
VVVDKNAPLRLALEEMRFNMDHILGNGDTIDHKTNNLLGAAGAILAIASTLQITLSPNRSVFYWYLLFFTVILYIVTFCFIVFSSKPRLHHFAMSSKWEDLDNHLLNLNERDALLKILAGYSDQIAFNEAINEKKAKFHNCSLFLLVTIMLLITVLLVIP